MISPRSRIARIPDCLHTELDGRVVVLGMGSGQYFEFDTIASDIWSRLDRYPIVADLCDSLARDYQAAPQVLQTDVCRLLGELEQMGLINTSAAGEGHA